MTEQDAKRAAATFEFPPFRAEAVPARGASGVWWLKVTDESGVPRSFATPQDWTRTYARMQAEGSLDRRQARGHE